MSAKLTTMAAVLGLTAAIGGDAPSFQSRGGKSLEAQERDRQEKEAERQKHSEERLSKAEAKRTRQKSRRISGDDSQGVA